MGWGEAHEVNLRWFHLDGTECVAGWHGSGPNVGQCVNGGGPVTPCPPFGAYAAGLLHQPYLAAVLRDGQRGEPEIGENENGWPVVTRFSTSQAPDIAGRDLRKPLPSVGP